MKTATNVLFVCTDNACRSQMAEGYARHFGEGLIEVASAGTQPQEKNPIAVEVMKEDGVDISGQASKPLTADLLEWADLLITLCADAAERIPALPANTQKRHWVIPDPLRASGSEARIKEAFRESRREIKQRAERLIQELIGCDEGA